MPYQQYREIQGDGVSITDADMEFVVETTKKGKTKFDVTLYNLIDETMVSGNAGSSTWRNFRKDNPLKVIAGWADGKTAPLVLGNIRSSEKRSTDEGDYKFKAKGVDKSKMALGVGVNKSFRQQDVSTIAKQIASQIGLSGQVVSVGYKPRRFVIEDDNDVETYLDELVEIAETQTGQKWEWRVKGGTLFFEPQSLATDSAVILGYNRGLISIGRVDDSTSNSENSGRLEFEMMMEPRLNKGDGVVVEPDAYEGVWKVESVKHESNTDDGTHVTSGRLLSTQNEYTVST